MLKSAVRPVSEKLEQFEGKLKSIDALKDALVAAITKLRDSHAEAAQRADRRHPPTRRDGAAVFQRHAAVLHRPSSSKWSPPSSMPMPGCGRSSTSFARRKQEAAAAGPAVGGDWQEALLGGELAHNPALNAR